MNPIKYIAVHCSATKELQDYKAEDIDRWHRQRGFNQIGYHYVVDIDGTIETGRPEHTAGAHVQGYNTCSIAVCYIGGLDARGQPKDTRTPAQIEALTTLLSRLKKQYPGAIIQGHRDFPGVNKACPCFNAKNEYKNL